MLLRMATVKQFGFTIIELVVVIAVIVALAAVAVPGLAAFVQSSRLTGLQSEFMSALSLARSEAVKRDLPVYVSAAASVTGNEFAGGWTIWVDTNRNGVKDAGEPTVRTHEALPSVATFSASNSAIAFSTRGYLSPFTAIQAKLCEAGSNTAGYRITVQPSGLSDVANNVSCP